MIPIRSSGGEPPDETEAITHYVLGGTPAGVAVAEHLQATGRDVAVVDDSYEPSDVPGFSRDPTTVEALSESGVGDASTVVVATGADRRNLLVAQLVRTRFDVPRVIAFVNDPDRLPLFEAAGHEPFCVTTALSEAFGEAV